MEEKEIIEKLENLENQLRFYQQLGAGFMVGEKKKPADEEKPAGELIGLKKETESHPFQAEEWQKLINRIRDCRFCPLFQGRTQAVPGEGNCQARLMFVGEAPGRDEDRQGRPFVGRAGQLLTKIIEAMGFKRQDVYIANVVKCRPPENRTPRPDEVKACSPYLLRQIELINPRVIVALGKIAAEFLLQTDKSISDLRGHFGQFEGIPVMPTFHPAYLVRNEGNREIKRLVWEDMKKVMKLLESS
ncbi:MAG TPA: uracil-DNA glycosylase [Candidatus Saccharicenans sp.]|jgi:DNA polymerase|nr:uracil-DNA glycosylase [Candidatus Saccharicenans sp.]HOP59944.1 uracil-DNA glycosylase [Candidatus Saccharicenans sp.]HPU93570.1 uracil-DNA glycosylase [Candidatus Saccharicenans sp.]HQM74795.1 uracil-DNA glycosylase [Candidatus Saccharicenans sp.]